MLKWVLETVCENMNSLRMESNDGLVIMVVNLQAP
jgi:hypothetical protein